MRPLEVPLLRGFCSQCFSIFFRIDPKDAGSIGLLGIQGNFAVLQDDGWLNRGAAFAHDRQRLDQGIGPGRVGHVHRDVAVAHGLQANAASGDLGVDKGGRAFFGKAVDGGRQRGDLGLQRDDLGRLRGLCGFGCGDDGSGVTAYAKGSTDLKQRRLQADLDLGLLATFGFDRGTELRIRGVPSRS